MLTQMPLFAPAYPEIFMAISALALLMLGVFLKKDSTNLITLLVVGVMVVAAGLALHGPQTDTTFGRLFVVNGFTVFAKVLTLLGAALTLLLINAWALGENCKHPPELNSEIVPRLRCPRSPAATEV
jgi:NADH-quinone oxidoreductase subunit N